MNALRFLAIALSLSLIIGETWRSWGAGILTILVGAAFIVSLAGMWLSITLPSSSRSPGSPLEK